MSEHTDEPRPQAAARAHRDPVRRDRESEAFRAERDRLVAEGYSLREASRRAAAMRLGTNHDDGADEAAPLAAQIRRRRLELDMTQGQLAELLGVRSRIVQRWEAGESRPRGENYELLVATLGLSMPSDAARPVTVELGDLRRLIEEVREQLAAHHASTTDAVGRLGEDLRQVRVNQTQMLERLSVISGGRRRDDG